MSDSVASLRHKIGSAQELESVVRTMKAMAASSIGQYENAVHSLDDYDRTVQLGLAACFRENQPPGVMPPINQQKAITAIIFGSDQGLVGQFNEAMVEYAVDTLEKLPGKKMVWAVGVRIGSHLAETDLQPITDFTLPNSIQGITPLVGQILIELEAQRKQGQINHNQIDQREIEQVYLFHNRPKSGSIYTPVSQRLLPLDATWRHNLAKIPWPTQSLPEVMHSREKTLRALVREYLFVTLFRACAESLASENASRLAAMQRAEKNIDELQEDLNRTFHRLRQSGIDEELFDVISGFEALSSGDSIA
ncbi:MAG: F0F1 ATP synthase subunit gamma [Zetaproteobacteria bacterium CG_4_9_14_3_um_filter_49_83]|nr:MAG: F0F1 ATP synthase subunit gamma [Zetaproteobacteria bacterium CG1_02_49_23]PIQ31674.1 MAG: F0F1 ATP synthase subunit gamma [Zetaproteobacteria bacterium CG17_big_fil_post_rev_8_21_14_2_50_50_13]PIV29632.1 MAG: F0F1 ATP synthase subunit gamma [Zetaproteobacteria bacterium CG02_land_8_20_14_3_00_50_9]PIY56775.1 MAG: F0F1 ATP synthase subunit gamma [Zetaproteobacteria bacterium CG_4_10_14_0_8_um_filter_49_80]PJA34227.1 MAG: F0F1 ATP synthase subunit gamma [Zetaproteobacteria bacterium CG_4